MANGIAANVVTMVFGNMGFPTAEPVSVSPETQLPGRTRCLLNSSMPGEDVVAGIRPLSRSRLWPTRCPSYGQLEELRSKLATIERFRILFSLIEKGTVCLQTEMGK
jgi:pyruvate,orthophosphate dikinase